MFRCQQRKFNLCTKNRYFSSRKVSSLQVQGRRGGDDELLTPSLEKAVRWFHAFPYLEADEACCNIDNIRYMRTQHLLLWTCSVWRMLDAEQVFHNLASASLLHRRLREAVTLYVYGGRSSSTLPRSGSKQTLVKMRYNARALFGQEK